MPTYSPLSTSVRLSVADLNSSTVAEPEVRKNPAAGRNVEISESQLRNGRRLFEKPIPFEGGEDTNLNFIGKDKDIPFYLVHAGTELVRANETAPHAHTTRRVSQRQSILRSESVVSQDSSSLVIPTGELETTGDGDGATDSRAARVTKRHQTLSRPPLADSATRNVSPNRSLPNLLQTLRLQHNLPSEFLQPQALAIQVALSGKTFIENFRDPKNAPQDLRIDVLFNGELVNCTFLTRRDRPRFNATTITPLIFAGTRIGYIVEHAWVIVPPAQHPDGSLRNSKRTSKSGVSAPTERWMEISKAIAEEAEANGYDMYGDRSPIGDYLRSLADIPPPEAIKNMREPGARFGVIDVIISAGEGRKYDASHEYLKEPKRLWSETYRFKAPDKRHTARTERYSISSTESQDDDVVSAGTQSHLPGTEHASQWVDSSLADNKWLSDRVSASSKPRIDSQGANYASVSLQNHNPSHLLPGFFLSRSPGSGQQPSSQQVRIAGFSYIVNVTSSPDDRRRPIGNIGVTSYARKGLGSPLHLRRTRTNTFSTLTLRDNGSSGTTSPVAVTPTKRSLDNSMRPPDTPSSPSNAGSKNLKENRLILPAKPKHTLPMRDQKASHAAMATTPSETAPTLGMTRRGSFSYAPSAIRNPSHNLVVQSRGNMNLLPTDDLVSRVMIKAGPKVIRDTTLTKPFRLAQLSDPLIQTLREPPSTVNLRARTIPEQAPTRAKRSRAPSPRTPPEQLMMSGAQLHAHPSMPVAPSPPNRNSRGPTRPASPRGPSATSSLSSVPSPYTAPKDGDNYTYVLDPELVTPELSKDCVLTYAEEGKAGTEWGTLRQIRSERSGHFECDSVVLGVRFVVG
ncbi:hypothetical protein M501DRAFT_1016343 [Patellaria atrata CBS 101060]|uniref:Uncharacterized protein n=1 Tax=Patellaria atrata CBS 101060 TaxID=1346257 RepID=A0A9P4VRW2_9PEZI|nr:hypothetical protein M501DRAFT_1016343 [Patellaria atrata CBS 101060]